MWGLNLNGYLTKAPPGFWNARAIFEGNRDPKHVMVDLLPDRQGTEGEISAEDFKDLTKWLRDKGLKMLREKLAARGVKQSDKCTIIVSDAPFYLYADPNGSYGYLYIAAWKETPCKNEKRDASPTNPLPV